MTALIRLDAEAQSRPPTGQAANSTAECSFPRLCRSPSCDQRDALHQAADWRRVASFGSDHGLGLASFRASARRREANRARGKARDYEWVRARAIEQNPRVMITHRCHDRRSPAGRRRADGDGPPHTLRGGAMFVVGVAKRCTRAPGPTVTTPVTPVDHGAARSDRKRRFAAKGAGFVSAGCYGSNSPPRSTVHAVSTRAGYSHPSAM